MSHEIWLHLTTIVERFLENMDGLTKNFKSEKLTTQSTCDF
jgi:hypothetical protein